MAVYEDYTDYTIRAWLQEPIHLPEEGRVEVAQRIRETPQQRHWWPPLSARRSPTMVPAVKFVVASVFLAVFGGLVLGGFLAMPSDPSTAPGAVMTTAAVESASPSPSAETELPADVADQVEALEAGLPDDWALPLVVRDAIAEGRFEAARAVVTQATAVLENLVEVNRLLPEVDLMPIVQPQFENAENAEELDAVTDWVERLPEGAKQSVGLLGELSDALPDGWTFPVVVNDALADQRFDDIPVAVRTAIDTVSALARADAELPDEGVLDSYRGRFESAATVNALQALTQEIASPTSGQGPGIAWDSGSVRLEADRLELHVGDTVFSGVGEAMVSSDPGSTTSRGLQVGWTEQGAQQAMYLYFAADEQDWWVTALRTLDVSDEGDWIHYAALGQPVGEMFRTPRGETFEGDVLLASAGTVPGVLGIEGLRLTAFAPGTGPGPLVGCENATAEQLARGGPLARGNPLRGTGILKLSPAGAETLLRDLGLCLTFRYEYPVGTGGYSERWCTAPPRGKITDIFYLDDGVIVVTASDDLERAEREQPPEGWNCPAN